MSKQLTKPEGQEEITAYLRENNIVKEPKKRTPPSHEKPDAKKASMIIVTSPDITSNPGRKLELNEQITDMEEEIEEEQNEEEDPAKNTENTEINKVSMRAMLEQLLLKQSTQEDRLEDLIRPLRDSINTLIAAQQTNKDQEVEITEIKKKHDILQQRVHQVKDENRQLKTRVIKLENRMLESNLIIHGLREDNWELEENRRERIYQAISSTVDEKKYSDRITTARNIAIRSTKRLGKYRGGKGRLVSICFEKKSHADTLYNNRSFLPEGVFVDREYTQEVEENRRILM